MGRWRSSWLTVLGVAGAVALPAASGCGEKSGGSGKETNAGSSTAGSGATSSGGGSSGAPSGGSGGNSSGAMGGSAGTDDTGGAAGESGGESSGAMGGAGAGGSAAGRAGSAGNPGGSGGASGSGGRGGMGGSGGSGGGAAGMVGTLGTPCTPRGALACAGNHQKLTVLCSGNDTWQPNQTCGDGQFCDSTPGPNVGTCRPELPECADGPGTSFCADDDKTLVTCGPDAVSTANEPCDGACHGDECRDVSDCPIWGDYDQGAACSRDCGTAERNATCDASDINCTGFVNISFTFGPRVVIRTPWADSPCTQCNGTVAYLAIVPSTSGRLRVTVPEPWHVTNGSSFCAAQSQCAIFSAVSPFYIASSSLEDGPVNVVVEAVDFDATCP